MLEHGSMFLGTGTFNPMIAVVFPGQGSQRPGMGKSFFDTSSAARLVFQTVVEATGIDVCNVCFELDEETLRQTENAQIALYTSALAGWAAFREQAPEIIVNISAGHSIGEYAALAASGVYSVADGARLVQKRGALMSSAAHGTMAAVLGLEKSLLEEACASVEGIAVVANDNCPGQLVISGEVAAVEAAGIKAKEMGAKRVLPLNVSGAFHSPLMTECASEMAKELARYSPTEGAFPVISNVLAEPNLDVKRWPQLLKTQLESPVRWTESMQWMIAQGITHQIEIGGGEVLSGLMKRTDKSIQTFAIQDSESLATVISGLQS